jgi:hypothetical protein
MYDGLSFQFLHEAVSWLLHPVVYGLFLFVALALWESGLALGERFGGLEKLAAGNDGHAITAIGRRRIERADLLARIGPMLGLMGTLIPLGPGIAALGRGEVQALAASVSVAFDTTVLGLLAGVIGFALGRLRRRWYDQLLDRMEKP